MEKKRVEYLDFAKGIGILLVVWAHAHAPFARFIYQFHMPFFFLISGILYNSKGTSREYIIRKLKSLYIPFVIWNFSIVFYKTIILSHDISVKKIISLVEVLLAIQKDGEFFGATWFLGALLWVSIVYKLLDANLKENKYKYLFLLAWFTCIMIVGFEITLPLMISRIFVLSFFYAVGVCINRYKEYIAAFDSPLIAVFSVMFFIIIGYYNSANMGGNKYSSKALFVIGSLFITYGLIYGCRILEKIQKKGFNLLKKTLSFMSQKSIDILIWQFVAFRIVIVLQLYLAKLPISTFREYYPMYNSDHGWWFLYFFVGVLGSVLIAYILSWGRIVVKKLLHI